MEEEKKKVLVTGSSGYLGGHLCYGLLNHGYAVRALVRRSSRLSALPPSQTSDFELFYGDITDFSSLLAAASGCQFIIHSAAIVESWLPDPSQFFTVNVGGMKNLIQVCKETNSIEKIVYTSSCFVLGPTHAGVIADENQVHSEKYFCLEYERSKVAADKIALQAASEGVPIVVVYPGVIYGSGKLTTGNIVAKMLIERFNWRLPGYFGRGNDKFSFSHVDDVVDGHISAMKKGRVGERYLLTGENASFKHVFDAAAILTNTSKPRFGIPFWVIEAYAWISVLFCRITGKLPLFSPPAVSVLRRQWAYSCDKAKKELDYKPRSLKEGLEEMLPWLKSSGFIKY
ncbi:uncharacterized protein LOC141604742 [Silene latifolia]|uniref:uncharacterized protein LOC141604742 n=1 Tax=Silene latifolia TaxID=37657 RepID=UPI003D77A5BE